MSEIEKRIITRPFRHTSRIIDEGLSRVQHQRPQGLDAYKDAGGTELSISDVRIHELIMFLNWLWNTVEEKKGRYGGHGPDHYLQRLESLLHRAEKGSICRRKTQKIESQC